MSRKSIVSATAALVAFLAGLAVDRFWLTHPQERNVGSRPASTTILHKLAATGDVVRDSTTLIPDSKKILPLKEIKDAILNLERRTLRQRFDAVDELVASTSPDDAPEILNLTEKMAPEELRTAFRNALLTRWAQSQLHVAMAYADKVVGAQNREQAIIAVLTTWAEQDAASALGWIKKLPPGSLHDLALQTLVSSVAEKDPHNAMALLEGTGSPRERFQGLASSIFATWAGLDPRAAAAKAAELPPGSFRGQAFSA